MVIGRTGKGQSNRSVGGEVRARIGYPTYGGVLTTADGGMEEPGSEANRKLPYNLKAHY